MSHVHFLCADVSHLLLAPTVRHFSAETVTITYVDPDGEEHPVKAEVGKNLLDVAHENNIELEGTRCGIVLWCGLP